MYNINYIKYIHTHTHIKYSHIYAKKRKKKPSHYSTFELKTESEP